MVVFIDGLVPVTVTTGKDRAISSNTERIFRSIISSTFDKLGVIVPI